MSFTFRLLRKLPRWARQQVREGVELVRFFGGVAAFWFAWTSVAFATFYIPSESMQPTLEVGDRIIVSKWAYGYSRHSLPLGLERFLPASWNGRIGWAEPERGDVVVLMSPTNGLVLIKRVAGIAGDTVEMRRGRLYINGEQIEREALEPRTYRDNRGEIVSVEHFSESLGDDAPHSIYERNDRSNLDDFGPVTVPEGNIFLMGDNRDNSIDSRAYGGPGFVPIINVIGRAETVPFTLERCQREPGLYCPTGRVWRGL